MEFLSFAIKLIVVAGLVALAVRWLFARAPNWLPVLTAMLLPPILFVPYGVFALLRDIGAAAEMHGEAPPNMVDTFADGIQVLAIQAVLWFFLACPVAIAALRLLQRQRQDQ